MAQEPLIAVFIDFENLALGVDQSKQKTFEVQLVLKRLLQKGRIVFKRAYCDWSRYRRYVNEFHAAGIELVDIPQSKMSGKNSADIRMVVDALELCYVKEHLDMFALVSGDSDFSPLVSKLKENDKRVIGCGVRRSSSDLLINNCDEFIFYDDLEKKASAPPRRRREGGSEKDTKRDTSLDILVSTVQSLQSDYDTVWASMIKQTIRRVHPDFSESASGFKNFTDLLEAAAKDGRIRLDADEQRGTYKVSAIE
ncbi:MAG: NYN domain-containing protein [Gammaproteobacteria bacterium]|nr:NYN domain-containing protein [Gammaproteobacteria bacterium]